MCTHTLFTNFEIFVHERDKDKLGKDEDLRTSITSNGRQLGVRSLSLKPNQLAANTRTVRNSPNLGNDLAKYLQSR